MMSVIISLNILVILLPRLFLSFFAKLDMLLTTIGIIIIGKGMLGTISWIEIAMIQQKLSFYSDLVVQIYPTELKINKTNSSGTEAPFLNLNLSITNGIVSSKIYDKRDDFNFEIVNFPFLVGDVL